MVQHTQHKHSQKSPDDAGSPRQHYSQCPSHCRVTSVPWCHKVLALIVVSAVTRTCAAGSDHLSHTAPTPLHTTASLLFLTSLWHGQPVRSGSPVDDEVREIMASNRTSEEKFQAVMPLQHRRYCMTSRTCVGMNVGECGYCRPCSCDDVCLVYGDCCPDKLVEQVEKVNPVVLKRSCRDNLYGGYTVQQRQQRLPNATSYYMTDTCPPSAPPVLAAACGLSSNYLPVSVAVTGSEGQVDVFANKYCAQCHGVSVTSENLWKTMIHCNVSKNFTSSKADDMLEEAADDKDCFIVTIPPPALPSPRHCYYDVTMITSCNVTGEWRQYDSFTERACTAYVSPKMVEGRLYQNVFCYICNSADPDEHMFTMCARNPGLFPMPFSALLDFSGAIYGQRPWDAAVKCADGEIYDDTTGECRRVHCSAGRHFVDGLCPVVFDSALDLGYSLYFSLKAGNDLHLHDEYDLLHVLPGFLEYYLIHSILMTHVRATSFEVSFQITDDKGRCSQRSRLFHIFTTVRVATNVRQNDLEHRLLSLRNQSYSLRFSHELTLNFTSKVDEHVWLRESQRGNGQVGLVCSTKVSTHHEPRDGDTDTVYSRLSNLLTLPKVALTHDEFHVLTSDLSLKVPWMEETIPLEWYESTSEGQVFISLDDFMPKIEAYRQTLEKADTVEVILSIVCTSLSLAGLALTFLTYAVLRPLRTAPGRNNMNLCVTLFLAQLAYLLGSGRTEVPGLCQALGILIHYLWLAAFGAMSVCSYHMWRVFTSIKAADDDSDQRRRFLQYTVYIWGAAAAVVVITLLAHIIATEGDDIGYGGRQCYLSTAFGVGVAMGVPVALTVSASIVFFSLTVRTIRQSPKLTRSREDERHVWVYVKLSTITGATWALAFVVFFTKVTELRYVFTIVNGLQGVFVCVSFVFNRRVLQLISACCRGGYPRLATTTTTSSGRSYRQSTMSAITRTADTSLTDCAPPATKA